MFMYQLCTKHWYEIYKDKNIISFEEFNKIKDEYAQQIISFIQTLLELNCDLLCFNNNHQSPLLFNINNKNYIIAKEYLKVLQNLDILTTEEYYNFLDIIISSGNCFDQDYIELINLILTNFFIIIEPPQH